MHHLTPDGKLVNYAAKNRDEFQAYTESLGSRGVTTTYGYWSCVGPSYFVDGNGWNGGIGRVNCITFHPTDANTIWIGCPSGGMWRTTNGGSSWTPLTDGMPRIGVSGIAVNYNSTNIIYLLSGDGDGGDVKSIGVMKTTDGGITWYPTGLSWTVNDDVRAYKLLMHPTNPAILFVVSTNGIYKTTNSGASWTLVHSAGGDYHDIEFKTSDPSIMYASAGSEFFRSTNTGDTWTEITSGVPTSAWRMAIGVSTANSAYVCLFTGPNVGYGHFVGVYRSTDSGLNFSTMSTTPNILGYSNIGDDNKQQTTYDLYMAVSRTSASTILTGGINCWKSTNSGVNWSLSSMWDNVPGVDYTHADIHALEINPLNNYLYCGSDGGFFRSTDFGENCYDFSSGLAINQSYRIAGYEGDVNLITNGGASWSNRGYSGTGAMALGGTSNPSRVYASVLGTNTIYMSNDAGGTFSTVTNNLPAGSITFIAVNPNNSYVVYVTYSGYDAGNKVFRSGDAGSSWTNITGTLPNIPVNCIAYQNTGGSPNDAVYIGTDVGVYYRDDNIGDWVPFMNGMPNVIVTDMEINESSGVITAATYGRSYWRSDLYSSCPVWYYMTAGNDPSNPNYTGFQHYEANDSVTSSRVITGGIGTDVTYKAGTYVRLSTGFHAEAGNKFKAILGPCSGTAAPSPPPAGQEQPAETPKLHD
jgi:photosystem II stability/assembly factor-like uncharacterized protein